MSNSEIEWTDMTWNPIVGCTMVSPGCTNCYALTMSRRQKGMALAAIARGQNPKRRRHYIDAVDDKGRWSGRAILVPEALGDPLHWREPCMVFVNSMSDLFHDSVPFTYVDRVFAVMAVTPQHTYQILTKRPDRMLAYTQSDARRTRIAHAIGALGKLDAKSSPVTRPSTLQYPLPNVWLGTSVEDRQRMDRIDLLRCCPAAVRFLSLEPLLEDLGAVILHDIHWAIVGGESGPGARPMRKEWVVSLRDQCLRANVPFFFKQWGGIHKSKAGRHLDGKTYDELPPRHANGLIPGRQARKKLIESVIPQQRPLVSLKRHGGKNS